MAKKAKKAKKAKAATGSGPAWVKSLTPKQVKDLNKLRQLFAKPPKCQRLNIVAAGDAWTVTFDKKK